MPLQVRCLGTPFTDEIHIAGAYAQIDYQPNSIFKVIAGGQFNKPENHHGDTVPRLGLITHLTKKQGMKVLYGQAYRSPSGLEKKVNTPGFQLGNPDLETENAETVDIQLFSQGDNHQIAATYFKSRESDLIRILPDQENPDLVIGKFQNPGRVGTKRFRIGGQLSR